MRVKRGVTARKRHKKLIAQTKGMSHLRRSSSRQANQAVIKALSYQYRDRRNGKRDFRALWITRINAGLPEGTSYSSFIHGLKTAKIDLDRKVLSELATNQPKAFAEVVKVAAKK